MADVTINYEGNAIATMSASGTKTLLTEGKYCTDDIEVVYVSPGGGGGLTYENGTFTPVSNTHIMTITGLGGTPKFIRFAIDNIDSTASGGGSDGVLKMWYGLYVLGATSDRQTNNGGTGGGNSNWSDAASWTSINPTVYPNGTDASTNGEIIATTTGFSCHDITTSYSFKAGYTYNWEVWY